MHIRALRTLLPLAVVSLLLVTVAPRLGAQATEGEKSVYVTVVDSKGVPIKDMQADEFGIKEDGVVREITSVKPASDPLEIVLMGDTTSAAGGQGLASTQGSAVGGTRVEGDIRTALLTFVHGMSAQQPNAEIELMEFSQAATTAVKFTSLVPPLEKGIKLLFPKPVGSNSVLLEALIQANGDLAKRPSHRRAIVVLNIEPALEDSQIDTDKLMNGFRKTSASLWVISLQQGTLVNPLHDIQFPFVINRAGGMHQSVVGPTSLENWLKMTCDDLAAQYQITYKRPASPTPPNAVIIGATRGKLYAGLFAPQ